MNKKQIISFLLCLFCINFSFSQVFHLVKDINTSDLSTGIYPKNFIEYKNKLFFCASTAKYGEELFVSDGTKENTGLFMDINKGDLSSSPDRFIVINEILYFIANRNELWKTDGSDLGTVKIKEFDGNYTKLINFNNTLYLSTYSDAHVSMLWKSDGTEQGTTAIKELYVVSNANQIIIRGNEMFFVATDKKNESQFWKSDGTEKGTVLVNEMAVELNEIEYIRMVDYGNAIYLLVKYNNSVKLWKSDGTNAGTIQVKTLNLNMGVYSGMGDLFVFNNLFYFIVNDNNGEALWKSDGTELGTNYFYKISTDLKNSTTGFYNLNNTLLFMASKRLWKLNSSGNGIELLKVFPGLDANTFRELTEYKEKVYFKADDGVRGCEIWQSDGTIQGTKILKDIIPQSISSFSNNYGYYDFSRLCPFRSKLYFSSKTYRYEGFHLWESNGTEEGTIQFETFRKGTADSYPRDVIEYKNNVYFTASTVENGFELWKTKGTENGTELFKDIYPGTDSSYPVSLTKFKNYLIFIARSSKDKYGLWKTDGTDSGTVLIKNFNSVDRKFYIIKDKIYFSANDGEGRGGLWQSDGTTAGTVFLKDVGINAFVIYNNELYFGENYGYKASRLWKTDGTERGTILVKDQLSIISSMVVFNNKILLSVESDQTTYNGGLWISDGTNIGTKLLFLSGYSYNGLFTYNNIVYFTGSNVSGTQALWSTDGTIDGTKPAVYEFDKGKKWSNPHNFFEFKGKLYFICSSPNDSNLNSLVSTAGTGYDFKVFNSSGSIEVLSFTNDKIFFVGNGGKLYMTEDNPENSIEIDSPFFENNYSKTFIGTTSNSIYFSSNCSNTEINYGEELWKLGNCSNSNSITTLKGTHFKFNKQKENLDSSNFSNCYCDPLNYLICKIETDGSNTAISDDVSIKMFIDEIPNENYVGRHYEIYQMQNGITQNFKVTLYFSQEDFSLFNLLHPTKRLPENSLDNEAKKNVIVEKFKGTSISGAINNYESSETIVPDENEVKWNNVLKRWEISFDTNGFGGYFIKSAGFEILTPPEKNNAEIYPNPVSNDFVVNFESNKPAKVIIFDLNGRNLIEKEVLNNQKIDISSLNSNVYLVKIITDTGNFIKKIIKN
jgi:ELWxxDGT repeat protein